MLFLHQYPAIWGLPSLSPFCIKVESYLRMTRLPYQIVVENNPRRGPKGKMPVLRDGAKVIPDSSFIIDYLKQTYGDQLDKDLDKNQKALSHATKRLIEENLYFVILYSRWVDKSAKKIITSAFSQFFPAPFGRLAVTLIRRVLVKQAKQQGMGRHLIHEVYEQGAEDIETLATILHDKKYFLEEKPHSIDASLYAFLITILLTPLANPLQQAVKNKPNLMEYAARMHLQLFAARF